VAVSHQGNVGTQGIAGGSAGPDTPEGAARRLLDVLDGVCRFGPVTLSDLVSRLDIPRGAVWRSLAALRQKGWVRMRHGDKAFELCAPVTGLFSHAHAARPEVEALMPVFTRLAESGPVHVDLGLFTARGAFRVVETTRKQGYADQTLSLTDDDIALAAQLHLAPADLVRHLTTFMERAGAEERQVIASGDHARTLRRLRQHGVVWQDDGSTVSLGRRGWPGVALRVELWRFSRLRAEGLRALVTEIVATEGE
jgi:DNA-binding IclR family transcriptional regulator